MNIEVKDEKSKEPKNPISKFSVVRGPKSREEKRVV